MFKVFVTHSYCLQACLSNLQLVQNAAALLLTIPNKYDISPLFPPLAPCVVQNPV